MSKVKLDTIKPWITSKITELLGGMEDDVVIDYVFNQLEADKVIKQLLLFNVQVHFIFNETPNQSFYKRLAWHFLKHGSFFRSLKRMNGPQVSMLMIQCLIFAHVH